MAETQQGAGNPAWFEDGGKAGQEEASDEQGEELAVEEDAEVQEVSPAELQPTDAELKAQELTAKKAMTVPRAEKGSRRAPPGFKIPKGTSERPFRFPKGIDVLFVTIPGSCTMYPHKGDRQVIIWSLTDGDEKLAYGRSTSTTRAPSELAKQMVRAIDGEVTNWTGDPGQPGADIDRFWHEIGPKGRDLLHRLNVQINGMNREELTHFFEHCIAVRNMG